MPSSNFMDLKDITSRVQYMHDDADGTYVTPEMVVGHAQQQYELLYNALESATNSQFNEQVIEIANVPAGTPNLDAIMASGQPLENIVTPKVIEWKLPGLDATNYRRAAGPLDAVRDVAPGLPSLDSWAWIRRQILLSKFAIALDLRITCTTMFDPLTDEDSIIQLDRKAVPVLAYMIGLSIAEARGMDKLVARYTLRSEDAFDDMVAQWTKEEQSRTRRVARISRAPVPRTAWPATTASNPATGGLPVPFAIPTYQDYAVSPAIPYALIEAYGGAGGITVTLGDVAIAKGQTVTVQKMDDSALGPVHVSVGAAQIAGYGPLYDLTNQSQFVTLTSDGVQWVKVGNN